VPVLPGTCIIEHGKFKIIIMDAPSDANSATYVKELSKLGVTDVVRTCEPTYSPDKFEKEHIRVHEMTFADGAPPPDETIELWVELITKRYKPKETAGAGLVAVHCVAGLGRAPVMAAIALMEMTSVEALDAVEIIRLKKKGAINKRQLTFLQTYKPRSQNKGSTPCLCAVM